MQKNKLLALFIISLLGAAAIGCSSSREASADKLAAASPKEESASPENTASLLQTKEESFEPSPSVAEEKTAKPKENTSPAKKENDSKQAETPAPSYTIERWEESKTMYVTSSVNVRKGPDTTYELCGSLAAADAVIVLGQADTGWYLINYGEEEDFVSNHYIQNELPAPVEQNTPSPVTLPDAKPAPQVSTPVPVLPDSVPTPEAPKAVASTIFVGDSRFVQMHEAVGDNGITWICENSKGYSWLEEKAIPRIDNLVGQGTKILINLGVNDTGHADSYLTLVNAKAAEWIQKGATVYYASVNPVWENPYVTNDQVVAFNTKISAGLSGVIWIDSYTYLTENGYRLVDGLHYADETYSVIYNYFIASIQ